MKVVFLSDDRIGWVPQVSGEALTRFAIQGKDQRKDKATNQFRVM